MSAPSEDSTQATRARVRRARAVVGALVLCVLAAEVGLRALGVTPRIASIAHERFGYVLLPDQTEITPWGTRRVNAQGFFGDDWPAPADVPESALVVAVLDCSHGTGVGVPPGAAWPAQLERVLKERGRDVLVLNASVGGWGIVQHAAHFEARLAAYAPDVVVLGVAPISAVPLAVRGVPGSWLRPILARSALLDLWSRHVARDRSKDARPARSPAEARRRAARAAYMRAPLSAESAVHWDAAADAARRIGALAAEHGGRTLALVAPTAGLDGAQEAMDPAECARAMGLGSPIEPGTGAPFRAATDGAGAARSAFLAHDPGHWTQAGHAAVAARVAERILSGE